jgi:hypothetical protein
MPSWRTLVMPREHGVWGLLAGAALVGLPLGSNLAGAPMLVAALAGVVLRQAGSVPAGTPGRKRVLGLAGVAAILGLAAGGLFAGDRSWLPWLIAAIGVGFTCLRTPAGRPWWSSALGGVAAGLLAGAVAAAGGAGTALAAVGAGALAMHLVSSVPLVRAQTRGDLRWASLALELHVIALVVAVGGWSAGLFASGIPFVFALGLARATCILDKQIPMSVRLAHIGLRELAWLPVLAAGVVQGVRGCPC